MLVIRDFLASIYFEVKLPNGIVLFKCLTFLSHEAKIDP